MKKMEIVEYFEEVETEKEYNGYYYSVAEAISIAVLGSLRGLKNVSEIHQWAADERVTEIFEGELLNRAYPLLLLAFEPAEADKTGLSGKVSEEMGSGAPAERPTWTDTCDRRKDSAFDGKMQGYDSPLHIISAQLSELGMTFASKSVSGKSNEIPAVQELLQELDIEGCLVVADALNCQKETAKAIIEGKGDYPLEWHYYISSRPLFARPQSHFTPYFRKLISVVA